MVEMVSNFSIWFVILSISISIPIFYVCLSIVIRTANAKKSIGFLLINLNGILLGTTLWCIHLIGLIVYQNGSGILNNFSIFYSYVTIIAASILLFFVVNKRFGRSSYLLTAAMVIGVGIDSMHELSLSAIKQAGPVLFKPWLLFQSLVCAFIIAFLIIKWLSLFIETRVEGKPLFIRSRWAGAAIVGCTVTGILIFGMNASPGSITSSVATAIFLMVGLILLLLKYETKLDDHSKRLKLIDRMYIAIIESANDAIITADKHGKILSWNQAAERIFGYHSKEMIGNSLERIMPEKYRHAHSNGMERYNQTKEKKVIGQTVELEGLHKSGETFPLELSLSNVEDRNHMYFTGIIRDISERVKSQKRIEELVYRDELTHLPNRRMLYDHLSTEIEKAKPNKEMVAVLFIDLDRFKQINDVYGHRVGDLVLIEITGRISTVLSNTDLLARQSGDEFVIVMSDTSTYQAGTIAKEVLKVINEPIPNENIELFVSASIGISLFPEDGMYSEDLFKFADTAMYQAKLNGGNQSQFFTSKINEVISRKMLLETGLRRAIEKNEIEIYYQPQVDVQTGEVASFEALVRWNHPELGLISPVDFIPLAEETGLIIPIGEWILGEACRTFKNWIQENKRLTHISVNISAVQFKQPDFPEMVERTLNKTELNPKHLELELTETIVQNSDKAIPFMHKLKGMGIKLSLDDFGTGYSSLSYLKDFPLDTLKIDKTFTQTLHLSQKNQAVVDTIIHMARKLDLNVIAEGVETEEQLKYLQLNHCYFYQGYLCSAPLPQDQIFNRFIASITLLEEE